MQRLTWKPYLTKEIHLRQNLICHRKKNQNWRQVLIEFIVSNIIDGIKIKLIEMYQFKVNQRAYPKRNPINFADEAKIIYWKKVISGSEQLVLLQKQNKEKTKKEIENFPN